MAQANPTFVDESRERIQQARTRVDGEIRRAQKELKQRRKSLEKQIEKNRKSFEKRARKQADQIRKDLEKNSDYKQLTRLRNDAEERIEGVVETLFGTLGVATRSDVKKIDRKLSKITKRLKEMETTKRRSNATARPPASSSRSSGPPFQD
ncbi:MAG: hypothetical protein HKP30_04740 [Myxococcales bacterium]|nr:hypothetical protein [Myxococcales bacterium]